MALVGLGGDGSLRPTYFELLAADALTPSLKAAVVYTLSVFSQRYPWLHRLLDYEDEVFAGFLGLLNAQSLAAASGTYSESLYGMKRVMANDPRLSSVEASAAAPSGMTKKKRLLSLVASVLFPYLEAKLLSLRSQHQRSSLVGTSGLEVVRYDQVEPTEQPTTSGSSSQTHHPPARTQRQRLLSLLAWLCPFIHTAAGGLTWLYQLLYLLEVRDVHCPVFHLLGLKMARVSGPDMAELDAERRKRRAVSLALAQQSAWPSRMVRKGLLRTGAFLVDHGRNALILSLFAFKFLDWWYSTAEPEMQRAKKLPPPPPPPVPPAAPGGVPLPPDPTLCPLCRRERKNPALLATSGFCFCYPCLFQYVQQHHRCPVSHIRAREDHIRSLYEDT